MIFFPKPVFFAVHEDFFLLILPLSSSADTVAIMTLNIWRDSIHLLEADMVYMLLVYCVTGNDVSSMERLGISRSKGMKSLICWRALVQSPW